MLYYWSKVTNTKEWESHIRHTQTFVTTLLIPKINWDDSEQVRKYDDLVSKIKKTASGNGKIDEDLDWEIERLISTGMSFHHEV
jgi:hypothetical protein